MACANAVQIGPPVRPEGPGPAPVQQAPSAELTEPESVPPQQPASPGGLPGAIGTAHPVLVLSTASDGGWAVLCQARSDTDGDGQVLVEVTARGAFRRDRLDTYLVEGSGDGERIDAFVSADPSGRYLVFERAERLILRDSWEQLDVDLSEQGAVLGTDASSFSPHRAAAFSADGRRMLYVRKRAGRDWVVVRELEGGAELLIDPGEGLLLRAEFDRSGAFIVMRIIDADTNGDGRLDWPHGKPRLVESTCTSPVPQFRVPPAVPDKPSVRVARSSGGPARAVRGFVTSFGTAGVIRRSDDRALYFDPLGGPAELWSPSACDGRLLHADPARRLLLIGCATEAGPREVALVTRDSRQKLGVAVSAFELDAVLPGAPRWVPLYVYPGPDARLLDLETGRLAALEKRDRVIASAGSLVLVRRNERLYWGDPGAALSLIGDLDPFVPVVHQPPLVFASPWVVDLARQRLLGRVQGEALALSTRGAVLMASRGAESQRLPMGPLIWTVPSDVVQ